MENTALYKTEQDLVNSLILNGDLSKLQPQQKVNYYNGYCTRLGLDPYTKPFELLRLNGKEVLYLTRSGAQQLNKLHEVSHAITNRELIDAAGIYQVTARAESKGRFTESIGAVNIANLKGDAYANAIMKAETKAKRRATLDLLGLGILDETEVEAIKDAVVVETKAEPETISEEVMESLKGEYMQIWEEYKQLTGVEHAAHFHPSRWKDKNPNMNAWKAAIKTLSEKVNKEKEKITA